MYQKSVLLKWMDGESHHQCHHHHHHGQRNKISIVVKTEDDDLNQTFVCRKRKPTKKGRIGVRFDEVEGDRIDIPRKYRDNRTVLKYPLFSLCYFLLVFNQHITFTTTTTVFCSCSLFCLSLSSLSATHITPNSLSIVTATAPLLHLFLQKGPQILKKKNGNSK